VSEPRSPVGGLRFALAQCRAHNRALNDEVRRLREELRQLRARIKAHG
jgi:hypothetical protein